MRFVIAIVMALFAAAGIAWVLRGDPGYALLSIGSWTVETSVAFAIVFLLVAFAVLYVLLRFLVRLWRVPGQARAAGKTYRGRRSRRLLTKGMTQLLEGRWKTAEISFMKGAETSLVPALHYIGAARAARRLGAQWRSEGYFYKADKLSDTQALIMKLSEAEFFLEDGKPLEARDILLAVFDQHKRQPRALELLATSYQQLEDWESLRGIMNDLNKSHVLDEVRYAELQRQTYRALLKKTSHNESSDYLKGLWRSLPEALRQDEGLLIDYAGYLQDHDAAHEAETLLAQKIKQHWSDRLVVGFGEIERGSITGQLETAEGWLQEQSDNPYLLLTCGRLAKRARQLGKARSYLERSLANLPTPDAYQALGEVFEETGDKEDALRCYRMAFQLLSGRAEEKEGVPLITSDPAKGSSLPNPTADNKTEMVLSKEETQNTSVAHPAERERVIGKPSQSAAS
jgi:HemY protein